MKTFTLVSLFAACASAYDFNFGMYTLNATYDSATNEIVIETIQPDMSWFGILLGSRTMTNTEAIVFSGNGASSTAKNYHSSGHSQPTISTT